MPTNRESPPCLFLKPKFKVDRAFSNLWFAKPIVCIRVAVYDNDRNQENDKTVQTVTNKRVECWIRGNHESHGNEENHRNSGCKPRDPQATDLENIRLKRHSAKIRSKSRAKIQSKSCSIQRSCASKWAQSDSAGEAQSE